MVSERGAATGPVVTGWEGGLVVGDDRDDFAGAVPERWVSAARRALLGGLVPEFTLQAAAGRRHGQRQRRLRDLP